MSETQPARETALTAKLRGTDEPMSVLTIADVLQKITDVDEVTLWKREEWDDTVSVETLEAVYQSIPGAMLLQVRLELVENGIDVICNSNGKRLFGLVFQSFRSRLPIK